MRLHLGCGRRHLEDWINVDARVDVGADLVADVTNLAAFDSESVDVIYACHVLEHVPRPQVPDVLAEWRRILKPGGILRLSVPDFGAIAVLYNEQVPMQRLIGLLCGRQNAPWNTHYMVYDWHLLCTYLSEAGFYGFQQWEPEEVHPAGYDDYSLAEIDGLSVSLNMEATRGA